MTESDRERDAARDMASEDTREAPLADAKLGEVAGGSHHVGRFGRRFYTASVEKIERFIQ